jgi:hypothetical protein
MLLRTDISILRIPSSFMRYYVRSFGSLRSIAYPTVRPFISSFHSAEVLARKRDKFSFSSKAPLITLKDDVKSEEQPRKAKRKTRSSAAKNSLRRVAVEAQRSRDVKEPMKIPAAAHQTIPKVKGLPPLEVIKADQCCSIIDSDGNLRRGGV